MKKSTKQTKQAQKIEETMRSYLIHLATAGKCGLSICASMYTETHASYMCDDRKLVCIMC